jgi:hypothetical protein
MRNREIVLASSQDHRETVPLLRSDFTKDERSPVGYAQDGQGAEQVQT